MHREKLEELKKWKQSADRKPLIVHGARQVGKTWLVKELGKTSYEKTARIDFLNNARMKTLFEQDLNTERILQGLKAESGVDITPGNTLIFLDEIQAVPAALTALKYFYEDMPQYHIVVAGSLLGITANQGSSFPVGKVDFLNLYPLSFREFLVALGEEQLARLFDSEDLGIVGTFREKFIDLLKVYYYVGGMPEAVKKYVETKSWQEVRKVQRNILRAYDSDFGKHAPANVVPRIRQVWQNIPAQLAKENKKYVYGLIREGARAKEFEMALAWLEDAGLIYRVARAESPKIPLRAYENLEAFKVYLVDVGLLAAMTDLSAQSLLKGSALLVEFKGAFTEQYVLGELKSGQDGSVAYWSRDEGSAAEVDFLIQRDEQIVPIEVKAEENLNSKSLKVYREKYQPKYAVRTSMSDYRRDDWLTNIPLYMIGGIDEILSKP